MRQYLKNNRLASKSMTLDDPELLLVRISRNFADLGGNNDYTVVRLYFSAIYRLRWYCWAFLR